MTEPLLHINGLRAAYNEKEILQEINLTIGRGEIVCIVGESGSGKSTLIKAIHGMDALKITQGLIIFDGKDITKIKDASRRQLMGMEIGLIPQNPAASFNPIRKYDVQFREALAGHGMRYEEEQIEMLLNKIGLKDGKAVLKKRPYELSGGMNQRIAIAAAIMFRPKLLLCDEATSALDVTTAGIVADELLKIRAEQGTSILMVTHHLGLAKHMADRIGIMENGTIIEYNTTDTIFESPAHEYTRRLIRDVPRLKTLQDEK